MRVKIVMWLSIIFSTSVFANEECKIINGFNLCEDAKNIAETTKKDIGIRRIGSEYVLRSVHAYGMRVISIQESIYSEEDINNLLDAKSLSTLEAEKLKKGIKRQSTTNLCEFYKSDEFVKDGGSFEVNYKYKDGEIFHTVLVQNSSCGDT
jgi:hypothetical protein